jgi:hypothetical protein
VGLLAVHHAADVPLLWASGSQDLLAVAGALAAIELGAAGRFAWAAAPMLLALLSKETVAFAPLIAALYARMGGEPWARTLGRAWPLFAAQAAWAGLWLATSARRPAISLEARLDPAGFPAALLHLVQSALGVEWPAGDPAAAFGAPPATAALLVALGVVLAGGARPAPARPPGPARGRVLAVGVAWAVLGALPLVPVAHIWSAYYYLFALCGVALAVGGLLAGRPAWLAATAVLLVGWTSENARRVPEFATARGPWTAQSHLNRHYLERGMTLAMRCLADLRRARPALPARGTLYFAGLPAAIAFQAADGPLLRWAYRDSSLRSYFLTRFRREQARRGPILFFQMSRDTLTEILGPDSLERIGFSLVLSDAADPARDVLALDWESRASPRTAYRLAFLEAARGDLEAARKWLEAAGRRPAGGSAPEIPAALALVAGGDTAAATALMERGVARRALDPGAHALLADLLLARGRLNEGAVEAYAARALAPDAPSTWRRWGLVAFAHGRDHQAAAALERYLELGGEEAAQDVEAVGLLREARRRLPGGDLAQASLHELGARRRRPPAQ